MGSDNPHFSLKFKILLLSWVHIYLSYINTMKKIWLLTAVLCGCFLLAGCSNVNDTETLNQVSLLQGLTLWDYYGSKSIWEVKELGNIGLGTFDGLNGELIMLDWIIYRANDELSIEIPSDDELIPFANVTFFDNDLSYELKDIKNIDELKSELDKKVEELGNNRIYVISIDGKFNSIHIRSERKQTEPYKPLVDVLRVDQTEKKLDNVEGTVVALYTPDYMGDLNAAGWHFHFITKDKQTGGHVLNLDLENGTIIWDFTDNFKLHLPDGKFFKSLDLTVNQDDDIKEVEQGK